MNDTEIDFVLVVAIALLIIGILLLDPLFTKFFKKVRVKIVKNGHSVTKYYPQCRGLFFWHNLSHRPIYNKEEAKEFAADWLKSQQKTSSYDYKL